MSIPNPMKGVLRHNIHLGYVNPLLRPRVRQ